MKLELIASYGLLLMMLDKTCIYITIGMNVFNLLWNFGT